MRQAHAEDGWLKDASIVENKLSQNVRDKLNSLANVTDGREVELQTSSTHIQWRYVGGPTGSWTNLISLSDLKGDQGPTGPMGPIGPTGPQGPKGDAGEPGTTSWVGITDKPSEFTPSAHDHQGVYVETVNGIAPDLSGNVTYNESLWNGPPSPIGEPLQIMARGNYAAFTYPDN